MKSIVVAPNAVLTSPAKPVTFFDKRLIKLISEMKAVLRSTRQPKGVGLAAPQIGEPYRIFLTRPKEKDLIRVFINAEILSRSDEVTKKPEGKLEGCLSIPAVWGDVSRATSLTLKYQDETGQPHEESFDGFLAMIIQHETDHTNGTLFTHRVLKQKGKLYKTVKGANGKEVLEEISL